ncbi:MAG TPA: hypothetical protein VFJ81_06660 [Gemmatimonadales bacterium]|nr:hypothetical protein [Gemmatimonadales bacterium]
MLTLILALVAPPACNREEPRSAETGDAIQAATIGSSGWATVRRDSTVLARFNNARVSAVVDGGHLSIELRSRDGTQRLVIEVDGTTAGRYRLVPTFEPGAATLLLVSRGMPGRISPTAGELTLTDTRDSHCSGAFTGRISDHGFVYRFEGAFELVPVRRL